MRPTSRQVAWLFYIRHRIDGVGARLPWNNQVLLLCSSARGSRLMPVRRSGASQQRWLHWQLRRLSLGIRCSLACS